jgi:hypothetical protein
VPDLSNLLDSTQLTLGMVCAGLAIGAWIVFKVIKKTIMLVLAIFLALGAAGGAGGYYFWN